MVDVFVIAGAAGSGKTTFGRALAKRLAIPLLGGWCFSSGFGVGIFGVGRWSEFGFDDL